MKTIIFNNNNYNIPESWSEVTVGMLIRSAELSEILEDAPVIAIISAYTGIPVKDLKVSQTKAVQDIILIMSFISKEYVPEPLTEFIFLNETYSCNDDLTDQRFEDFMSIQTCLYNYRDEPYKALPRLIAIYCKREGEVLDDFNLNDRTMLFLDLPMTIAKDIEAFFLLSLNSYKSIIQLSSILEMEEDIVLAKLKELKTTVKKSKEQIGMSWHTKLLIGLFQIYLMFITRDWEKYYNSKHINSSKKTLKTIWKNWHTKTQKNLQND